MSARTGQGRESGMPLGSLSVGGGWQPLTPGGVAALGRARLSRLLAVEALVAGVAAGCVVWVLATGWFPVITAAIDRLPDRGGIHEGRLEWAGPGPETLAETPLLSIEVAPGGGGSSGQTADVRWVFGGHEVWVCSLFGCLTVPYPRRLTVAFNRLALEPWWGAWRPAVAASAWVLTGAALVVVWSAMGLFYSAVVAGLVFLWDRELTRAGCWRLACAALLPGALFLSVAILAYGLQQLRLIGLLVFAGMHLVISWVYVVISPLRLPRRPDAAPVRANPFAARPPDQQADAAPGARG